MCNEMGIETGIDLEALIECATRRRHRRPPAARLGHEGRQLEAAARPRGLGRLDAEPIERGLKSSRPCPPSVAHKRTW